MENEPKEREMKRFKILMMVVAAFAAVVPVYQCGKTLMRF
jgi:hypothetical protein